MYETRWRMGYSPRELLQDFFPQTVFSIGDSFLEGPVIFTTCPNLYNRYNLKLMDKRNLWTCGYGLHKPNRFAKLPPFFGVSTQK